MALGAGETTPFKLTAAYAAFVNGGRRVEPHLIELVQDRDGKTIFRADQRDCPRCDAGLQRRGEPALSPARRRRSWTRSPPTRSPPCCEGVVQRGTAAGARVPGPPARRQDRHHQRVPRAWFVGFSPDMVVGVFIGFDDNRSLGDGETGRRGRRADLHRLHAGGAEGQPAAAVRAAAGRQVRARSTASREAFRPAPSRAGRTPRRRPRRRSAALQRAVAASSRARPASRRPPRRRRPRRRRRRRPAADLSGLY